MISLFHRAPRVVVRHCPCPPAQEGCGAVVGPYQEQDAVLAQLPEGLSDGAVGSEFTVGDSTICRK